MTHEDVIKYTLENLQERLLNISVILKRNAEEIERKVKAAKESGKIEDTEKAIKETAHNLTWMIPNFSLEYILSEAVELRVKENKK